MKLVEISTNATYYFHNLKFDGNFILDFLLNNSQFSQATNNYSNIFELEFLQTNEMKNKTFKYSISEMGQWYTITVRLNNGCYLRIKDSLKLFPFRLEEIAKGFGTKHKKLTMEYEGFRYPNCPISDTEKEYIFNDVFVLKEALELFFKDNPQNKLTIGSCCLTEFKNTLLFKEDYFNWFPNIFFFW